ncbi:MAG TPA: hypothetical protein VIM84_07360, partial [Gemmatimonadales bacterium]
MKPARLAFVAVALGLPSQIHAQASVYELQAGLGYARLFDAGGISFAAAVDRSLSAASSQVHHAVGGSFWYARTAIATRPDAPDDRRTLGLGARYQLSLGSSRGLSPFLAVPLQFLYSNIPDRADLVGAQLVEGVPEPPPPIPEEDTNGGAVGWGTGLELGFRLRMGDRLSGQTSVQGLYQDIYDASSSHGAWTWHA